LPPEQYYLLHNEKEPSRFEVLDEFKDTVSLENGNKDGFSLCGPRVYNIDFKEFEPVDIGFLEKIPKEKSLTDELT